MFKQPKQMVLGGLSLSLVGFLMGYSLKNSIEVGLCLISEPSCINSLTRVGNALFYGMGALAVVFFILLLVPSAFPAWKRFAQWFVPIAAIIFIFYTDPGSGDLFSPYAEQVYMFIAKLYVVISVGIVAAVYFGFLKPAKTKLKK